MLVLPPVVGLAFAAASGPADPYAAGTGVRWSDLAGPAAGSLALATATTLGAVAVGGILGWAEARWSGPWMRLLTVATALPLVIPSYVLAATLARVVSEWLGAPPTGVLPAVGVLVLSTAPLVQMTVASALRRGSAAEEEAAASLGASPWACFVAVHLPRLRPAVALSALIVALYAVSDFGAVAVLDAPVLTWRMYDAVARQDLPRAAALGAVAFVVVLPLALAVWALRGGPTHQGVANPRPPAQTPVGWASGLAVGSLGAAVVLAGVVVPVGTLLSWVVDGWQRQLPFADLTGPVLQTVGVAAVGSTVLVALAALPALPRGGRWLEAAVYGSSVLPGILVAFGWVGAALGLARGMGQSWLYGALLSSGVLLGLAYAARFLAEVHAPLRAGAVRLDDRLEAAVLLSGAPWRRWLSSVAWPRLRPSVRTAWLLGVVVIAKELPITLILGTPAGLRTLAFRVWDRHQEALWHDAGAAGLALVVVALLGRALVSRSSDG